MSPTALEPLGTMPAPAARRRPRTWAAVGALGAAVVLIVVLVAALSDNVVYFRTVSEAVGERTDLGARRIRMAGQVVPGTIRERPDGVTFALTDGRATVRVVHRGDPPQLFKDDAPVVAEGRFAPDGRVFRSERIMIRHGNEYRPPKVDTGDAPAPDTGSASRPSNGAARGGSGG